MASYEKLNSISPSTFVLPTLIPENEGFKQQETEEMRYVKILHCTRIKTIYSSVVLKISKRQIVRETQTNDSSVQNIIKSFKKFGRTNRQQYMVQEYLEQPQGQVQKVRGRNKLVFQPYELQDPFGEIAKSKNKKRCALKLYVDQDASILKNTRKREEKELVKMKLFTQREQYPYELGVQLKELEVVVTDVTKDDGNNNNNKNIFTGPLSCLNQIEEYQRLYQLNCSKNQSFAQFFKPNLPFPQMQGGAQK